MRKYTLIPFQEMNRQTPKLSSDQILDSLPKSIRNKVKAILSHIDRNDNYIEWNEKGEVTINGDIIPSSQIIDLIKCCFYPYKDFTPEGFEQFKAALAHINTPHTLIGGGALPPPPGLPNKKRSPNNPNKKKWVWHQM